MASNNKAGQKLHADIRKQAVSLERQAVDADLAGHPEMAKELRRRGALRNEDAVRLDRQMRDQKEPPSRKSTASGAIDNSTPAAQAARYAKKAGMRADVFRRAVNDHLKSQGKPPVSARASMTTLGTHLEKHLGSESAHKVMGRVVDGDYAKRQVATNPNVDAVRNLDAKAMGAKRKQPATPSAGPAKWTDSRGRPNKFALPPVDLGGIKDPGLRAERAQQMSRVGSEAISKSTWAPPTNHENQLKASADAERSSNLGRLNTGLAVAGTGITVANAFNRARAEGKSAGDAAIDAAKAGAVPAAIAAANPISRGAGHVASGAFELSKAMMSQTGFLDFAVLNMFFAKGAVISGAVGVAAKGVEIGAKIAGKVAAPAVAAYGAYQGSKEDVMSPGRGAARGAIRTLDPTGIFMAKGLGERAFDAAFGSAAPAGQATPAPKRLSDAQAKSFNAANASFGKSSGQSPRETEAKPKERAGQFVDVTNAHGTTFQRRNPKYGEWADG